MSAIRRTASGAAIALVLALAAVAPAAAAQPSRAVYHLTGGTHAAGEGCAFDISYVDTAGSRQTVTDFSDGREEVNTHAVATLTNESNGKTFVHKAFFHDVSWFDATAGVYRDLTNGQVIEWFYPGDVGPFGVVGPDGAAYRIEGTVWLTWDPDVNAITEFSYVGTVTDVCALLA